MKIGNNYAWLLVVSGFVLAALPVGAQVSNDTGQVAQADTGAHSQDTNAAGSVAAPHTSTNTPLPEPPAQEAVAVPEEQSVSEPLESPGWSLLGMPGGARFADEEDVIMEEGWRGYYDRWVANRLEVGFHWLQVSLLERTKGQDTPKDYSDNFVGSIDELKNEQAGSPVYFYATYFPFRYVGFGVTYDKVLARTWDSGGGDGVVVLSGPVLFLQARYCNRTRFTPYMEADYLMYSASFDANAKWAEGGVKEFVLNDQTGYGIGGGLDVAVARYLSFDVYARYVDVTIDGEYLYGGEHDADIVFTMTHLSMGAGLKGRF